MKCPICKTIDPENTLIEKSRTHSDEFYYFYCLYGCDSFTMEQTAYHRMKEIHFSDQQRQRLIEIALERVIEFNDLETL